MTINEAIEHCKDVVLHCDNKECAYEHVQLMDWLKELKCLRLVVDKKYLDDIALLKKAWGNDYDYYFEKNLVEIWQGCLQNQNQQENQQKYSKRQSREDSK